MTYTTKINFKSKSVIRPDPSDDEEDKSDDEENRTVAVKEDPQFVLAVTRGHYPIFFHPSNKSFFENVCSMLSLCVNRLGGLDKGSHAIVNLVFEPRFKLCSIFYGNKPRSHSRSFFFLISLLSCFSTVADVDVKYLKNIKRPTSKSILTEVNITMTSTLATWCCKAF